MNRLELGKFWLARLGRVMPDASSRMVTRLAWHLAAISVSTDEELIKLPDVALAVAQGGSRQFLDLRLCYLQRLSMRHQIVPRFVAHSSRVKQPTFDETKESRPPMERTADPLAQPA